MLNELYQLLESGNRVTILIIPYTEHEPTNVTLARRLDEEVELTRLFYQGYLGFEAPHLSITATSEMRLSASKIAAIQNDYMTLYQSGDPAVTRLVKGKQSRSWASPNITFVPKCIAAIEDLSPNYLIAGEKHVQISECFSRILLHRGRDIPSLLFPDLLDLRMSAGMDRRDTVDTYIDVSEHEDFVLHKLSSVADDPSIVSAWLEHFEREVLHPAPERLKTGVVSLSQLESGRVLALARFLANVRQLVPYQSRDPNSCVSVTWSDALYRAYDETKRGHLDRVIQALYRNTDCYQVDVYRAFTGGKSGSLVFGLRELEGEGGSRVSNLAVLKVGPSSELLAERANYEEFIASRRTAAFMAVKPDVITIEGLSGILYEDAHRFLGAGLSDRLEPLETALAPGEHVSTSLKEVLHDLFRNHLYEVLYKHGNLREFYSPAHTLNEFLPALVRIQPLGIDGHSVHTSPRRAEAATKLESYLVQISEVNLARRLARGFTDGTHDKIDIDLRGIPEQNLQKFAIGRRLNVEGAVVATRSDYYSARLQQLNVRLQGSSIVLPGNLVITSLLERTEALVDCEYRNVRISAIHGDLHGENVLTVGSRVGVIDYGKMRANWPALYDVSFLLVDLKLRLLASRVEISRVARIERAKSSSFLKYFGRENRQLYDALSLLDFDGLPAEIRGMGPRPLYDLLTAAICMGRLKFDLPVHMHHMQLLMADAALSRAGG